MSLGLKTSFFETLNLLSSMRERENVYAGKIKATSAYLWFCKSPLCQPDSATRCSECPLLETLELLSILCGRLLAKLACVLTRKNVNRQTESHNFLCKNNVTFGKASFVNEVMLSVPCLSSLHLSAFLNHKVTQIWNISSVITKKCLLPRIKEK